MHNGTKPPAFHAQRNDKLQVLPGSRQGTKGIEAHSTKKAKRIILPLPEKRQETKGPHWPNCIPIISPFNSGPSPGNEEEKKG